MVVRPWVLDEDYGWDGSSGGSCEVEEAVSLFGLRGFDGSILSGMEVEG